MNFVSLEQFKQMWEMQDRLNTLTSGMNWPNLNQNWNLAIKSEIMEFFDYIGWKWWKTPDQTKKPTDLQARLELVDIWHFLLSSIIEFEITVWGNKSDIESVHEHLILSIGTKIKPDNLEALKNLDSNYGSNGQKVFMLSEALLACGWTWQELYAYYIGKNVLNEFRQENGYKEGTYQKIWAEEDVGDLEDNYFLEQFIEELILEEQFSPETLKNMLATFYHTNVVNSY